MRSRLALSVALAICGCAFFASSSSAQIVYEPVRYQFGQGANVYYYGGSDPAVHDYAHSPSGAAGQWGRVNGWNFASGNIHTHREVSNEPTRVFVDALPYRNAHFFGFTPNDARNEAYARLPRYWRKGDLLNAAIPAPDRGWIVPADAQPIRIIRTERGLRIENGRPMPRPLMIIPKDQLQKQRKSDKTFASAR